MKIALGVTGCIAAYKSVEVMRRLQKSGVEVQVVMTRAARKFVTPLTFEALSGRRVISSMFRREISREIQHIQLAQEISLLAVAPATANILGKFVHGIADDFLSTLYLSCPSPVLIAPAMNVEMWNHEAVQKNLEVLRGRGHHIIHPETGKLACGTKGMGRLAEVDSIVDGILALLSRGGPMAGVKVLVTAGPTVEDIDPVRFISNRSSGKMGYAIAEAASRRGAEVHLVSGPSHLKVPPGVRIIDVRTAAEMKAAVLSLYPEMDVVLKAAAVADYRPAECAIKKLKKGEPCQTITLLPTDDILATLGDLKTKQVLIGFAMESDALIENARAKMNAKRLDMIVANDVSSGVFGSETATVLILAPGGEGERLELQPKSLIAERLLDHAMDLLERRRNAAPTSPRKITS